jgi:hypothetical protein
MNDYRRGESARLKNETVTIASVFDDEGRRSYLVEHTDGTFSRVAGSALMPLGAEKVTDSESKLKSIAELASGFMRAPSKRRTVLR